MNKEVVCSQCEDLLDEYIDDELDAKTHSLISNHILDCQDCQYTYKLAQIVDEVLCDLPSPEPSQKLYNQVTDYIESTTDDSKWEQLTMFDITPIHQSQSQTSTNDDEVYNTESPESNWIQITLQDLPDLHREFVNLNQ